jgi:hypothetical protein
MMAMTLPSHLVFNKGTLAALLVALAVLGTGLPAHAQFNYGPNAGAVQSWMMNPIQGRYWGNPDMFYIDPTTVGNQPPKGYENPVTIQDGTIRGQIIPKLRPPASSQQALPPISTP